MDNPSLIPRPTDWGSCRGSENETRIILIGLGAGFVRWYTGNENKVAGLQPGLWPKHLSLAYIMLAVIADN